MLLEPDGSTRIVEYYADSVNGFNANVRTIDGPMYYGGSGIDDGLMMMDQKLIEQQKLEMELQQNLELELQQKLDLQQKMEMEIKKPKLLKLSEPTGFSYSNQVVHH